MFKVKSSFGIGRGVQITMARIRANVGMVMNSVGDEVEGRKGSLMNSLMPSAIGCRRPNVPTRLGPFRSCM